VKMDVAAVALWLLVAVAALVCLAAGAMAFHLRASDAAGNGLAQAYLACTLGLCWLLVGVLLLVAGLRAPHPSAGDPSWTWIGRAALVLFLVAIGGQAAGFAALCTARDSGLLRVLLQLGVAAVPLAFVVHAAWRGLGVPVPAGLATWGCAAVVVLGSGLAVAALASASGGRRAAVRTPLDRVTYPALLVLRMEAVHVVRGAADVRGLPEACQADELLVIDALGRTATLRRTGAPLADADAFALEERHEAMDVPAVVGLLLRIAKLHADPQRDAEIRRLLPMQRDVSGLSFVLTRS